MKILVELPEWQYKEIKGDKGISEGVMINALCAIRLGKPVEQEPVLDKIRADIQNGIHHFLDGEPIIEIKEVLQIIDKYKTDKEQE